MTRFFFISILAMGLVAGCQSKNANREASEKALEAQDKAAAAQEKANQELREAQSAQAQADMRADQAAVAAAQAAEELRRERDAFLNSSSDKLRAFDERLAILEARAAKDPSAEARAWVDKIHATRARIDSLTSQALAANHDTWPDSRQHIDDWVGDMQSQLDWGEARWSR